MASLSNINGIFDVHSTGAVQFNGNHGTAGQILKSNGNAAPTWIPQSDIVGAYLPLAGGTLTGATATASGISFTVGGALTGTTATFSGFTTSATGFGINYVPGATVPMVILANATTYGIFYREATPDYIEFKHNNVVQQSFDGSGNVTIAGDFTVSGGDITLGGTGRIQGVDTVTDSTDAANKAYVDAHPGSGGTVTSVAVTAGTGITASVANSTTTPNITITNSAPNIVQTSVTGASGYLDTNRGTPSDAAQYWQASGLGTTEAPTGDWYTTLRLGHGNPTTYYSNTLAIKMTGSGTGDIYTQNLQNGTFQGWKKYWNDSNLPSGSGVTSLVAGTGISLTNASGPAVTVTATTQFSGPTFTSRNNTNGIAVDSATSNMSGYIHTSSAAGYADGGLFVAAYNSSWVSQIFSNFRTGEIAVRGKNSGTWQGWRTVWDSVNLPNPVQSSGVTSVATGSGLTGGTITSTGTLSVDSTVIRTTGNQSITGNTTFYPSSTSTSYSTAAIELMASSSGTSGTPPRISWHWGGVVASSITIEANGTIAVRNNPGNAYEQFKASIITATSNFSGNLTGNVTGNVTGSSGSCTGNSATATLATTATNANNVVITGYGNSTFTFYQSSGSFSGFSGWHNYYIGNHGNGANYYNTIIAIPFWGSPRYSRLEGNVQRGPFEFWTSERTIISTHDVTAPRYYDTNTTYYGDFASTSNINALTLVGTLSGQNGYFLQDVGIGFNSGNIGGKLNIQINTSSGIGIKNNLNGVSNPTGLLSYTSASMNAGGYHLVFQAAPTSGSDTNMLLCNLNGNLRNRNNSYGQYSDETIKENITDATPKLEDVKKLKVKNFNFIGDDLKQIGLIAQETEKVFPGLVEDDLNPQGDRIKSLKYSVLVPILVKAIQELEVRVKELENK
jgi:hypothetical protein